MPWAQFTRTLLLTGLVEGGLSLVYARWRRCPAMLLLSLVLLMNVGTQLVLWLALLWQGVTHYWLVLITSELLIWFLEGLFLFGYLRSLREAWGLSLLLNGASFAVGLALPI